MSNPKDTQPRMTSAEMEAILDALSVDGAVIEMDRHTARQLGCFGETALTAADALESATDRYAEVPYGDFH